MVTLQSVVPGVTWGSYRTQMTDPAVGYQEEKTARSYLTLDKCGPGLLLCTGSFRHIKSVSPNSSTIINY